MFKSKVVIVTGSSSGIGATTAVKFAAEGANVILHGRNEAGLQKIKEQCVMGGNENKVHMVAGDISSEEVRKKLINETIQRFGRLDVLVNNAGLYNPSTFSESTMDIFDHLFDVNVRSLIALTQLAAPHLIAAKGNIVNISSDLGVKPSIWAMFYSLTKATLDHFTKCLALDLGPKGVRVNSVNPGYVPETEVLSKAGMTAAEKETYIKMASDNFPLRRPGKSEDIADAILFLASEKASFVTGILFSVDGGSAAAGSLAVK
jgi:NAD(P)-dependent dehydrogenase (short-subunit alcohol dehydrogenase family)